MTSELFDMNARALRRDRAARQGPELFLHERAFADCLDRIAHVRRRFRRALLLGCPDPAWIGRLRELADEVDGVDPGPSFANAIGGRCIVEDRLEPQAERYDLCLAVGTLDTVNDLPLALRLIHASLAPQGFFLGAFAGGESLPRLRSAMRAADEQLGAAYAHVHPRIEPAAVAPLLSGAGFLIPVVDVDRVQVRYASFAQLIGDLRAMAATNILTDRPRRPVSRAALASAAAAFAGAADGGKTAEQFDIIHFAAWTPAERS